MKTNYHISRRSFLKTIAAGAVGTFAIPIIVPSSVFGASAPISRINIGIIGCGRIARDHDIPGVWQNENVRITAVCDVDTKRLVDAKKYVSDQVKKVFFGVLKNIMYFCRIFFKLWQSPKY